MSTNPITDSQDYTPRGIINILDNPATLLIARILETATFTAGGLTKLFNWDAGVTEMVTVWATCGKSGKACNPAYPPHQPLSP